MLVLAEVCDQLHVGLLKDHAMVPMLVDPRSDAVLDLVKVDDHSNVIEHCRRAHDLRLVAVPMQAGALALVIRQPVSAIELERSHAVLPSAYWTSR